METAPLDASFYKQAPRRSRDRFAGDSPLEGAGFEPSVPRQESRRFEPASVPSRGGRCRRGGDGPGGDRRPDRAVEIADRRWCASEPLLESRIKPSRRVRPSEDRWFESISLQRRVSCEPLRGSPPSAPAGACHPLKGGGRLPPEYAITSVRATRSSGSRGRTRARAAHAERITSPAVT